MPSLPSSFLSLSGTTVTLPLPGRQSSWNISFVCSFYKVPNMNHPSPLLQHDNQWKNPNRKGLPRRNFLILKTGRAQAFQRPCTVRIHFSLHCKSGYYLIKTASNIFPLVLGLFCLIVFKHGNSMAIIYFLVYQEILSTFRGRQNNFLNTYERYTCCQQ